MKILMPNGHIYDFWNFKHAGPDDSPDALGNITPAGLRLDYITHAFSEGGAGTAFQTVDTGEGVSVSWSTDECKELWKHFISVAYGEDTLTKIMWFMEQEGIEKVVIVEGQRIPSGPNDNWSTVPVPDENEIMNNLLKRLHLPLRASPKFSACRKALIDTLTDKEKVALKERFGIMVDDEECDLLEKASSAFPVIMKDVKSLKEKCPPILQGLPPCEENDLSSFIVHCSNCYYAEPKGDGYCYMFREKPECVPCGQYKDRNYLRRER